MNSTSLMLVRFLFFSINSFYPMLFLMKQFSFLNLQLSLKILFYQSSESCLSQNYFSWYLKVLISYFNYDISYNNFYFSFKQLYLIIFISSNYSYFSTSIYSIGQLIIEVPKYLLLKISLFCSVSTFECLNYITFSQPNKIVSSFNVLTFLLNIQLVFSLIQHYFSQLLVTFQAAVVLTLFSLLVFQIVFASLYIGSKSSQDFFLVGKLIPFCFIYQGFTYYFIVMYFMYFLQSLKNKTYYFQKLIIQMDQIKDVESLKRDLIESEETIIKLKDQGAKLKSNIEELSQELQQKHTQYQEQEKWKQRERQDILRKRQILIDKRKRGDEIVDSDYIDFELGAQDEQRIIETLEQEHKNVQKQIRIYQNEYESQKSFIEEDKDPVEYLQEIESDMQKRETTMEKKQAEVKNLERIIFSYQKKIDNFNKDAEKKKLRQLQEEFDQLKNKEALLEKEKQNRLQQQQDKKTMIELIKQRCKENSIEIPEFHYVPNKKQPKQKKLTKEEEWKIKQREREIMREENKVSNIIKKEKNYNNIEMNQQSLVDVYEDCEILKNAIKQIKRQQTQELSSLQDEYDNGLYEITKYKRVIRDKEQEKNIAIMRFETMRNFVKQQNQLPQIPKSRIDQEKMNLLLVPKIKSNTRQIQGCEVSHGSIIADDGEVVISQNHRIKEITFYYSQDQIYGYYVEYEEETVDEKGKKQKTLKNKVEGLSSINRHVRYQAQEAVLTLKDNDYIIKFEGSFKRVLDYINIETKKGKRLRIGKTGKLSQKFEFDLKDKVPVTLFGGLDYANVAQDLNASNQNPTDIQLAFIGVECMGQEHFEIIQNTMLKDLESQRQNQSIAQSQVSQQTGQTGQTAQIRNYLDQIHQEEREEREKISNNYHTRDPDSRNSKHQQEVEYIENKDQGIQAQEGYGDEQQHYDGNQLYIDKRQDNKDGSKYYTDLEKIENTIQDNRGKAEYYNDKDRQ